MALSVKTYNVVMHSVSFMLIFTAFQTSGNIQTAALNNVERDGKYIFHNTGYISLTIIYTVFSLANFIAPPILSMIGPRGVMFIGGCCYAAFIGSIIYPYIVTLYAASVVVGIGAALIWTAQGNFLTINSNEETIGRNSGIFWGILQCSLLFGNMFVYFYFKGEYKITDHSRQVLYTVLLVCALIGTFSFIFLRKTTNQTYSQLTNENENGEVVNDEVGPTLTTNSNQVTTTTPFDAFRRCVLLLKTRNMILLSTTIAYTGFELTFFSGIFGNAIGNIDKSKLSDPKRQIGLIGMSIGVGEIVGGLLFGIFGKLTNKYGRDPVVLIGFLVHMVTFYLIFLNVPNDAPLNTTSGESWLEYNLYIYVFSAFLLGFGDSSFNTQIYSILGTLYAEDSAPAFALFKFVQSVAAAIGFAYGTVLTLKYQLLILVITALAGTITFLIVERTNGKRKPLVLIRE